MRIFPSSVSGSSARGLVNVESAAAWWALLMMLLGGGLRGFWDPTVWVLGTPWRWWGRLAALSGSESSWDPHSVGDFGASVGILQFNTGNEAVLSTIDEKTRKQGTEAAKSRLSGRDYSIPEGDWRWSPFWSGYYAVDHIARVVRTRPSWWVLALPMSYGPLTALWRVGPGASDGNPLVLWSFGWTMVEQMDLGTDGATSKRAWTWRALTSVPAWALLGLGVALVRRD